jgi:hypothetical protein
VSEEFDSRLYVHNLPESIRAQISLSETNLPLAIENFVWRTSRISNIALTIGTHYLNEKGKKIGISSVAAKQVKGFTLEESELETLVATAEVIEMLKLYVRSLEKQYQVLLKLHGQV